MIESVPMGASLGYAWVESLPYLTLPTGVRAQPPTEWGARPRNLFGWGEGGGGRQVTDWDRFNPLGGTIRLPGVIIHLH